MHLGDWSATRNTDRYRNTDQYSKLLGNLYIGSRISEVCEKDTISNNK